MHKGSPVKSPFGMFGSLEFRTNGAAALNSWSGVMQRVQKERAAYAHCLQNGSCPAGLQAWRQKLSELKAEDPYSQLRAVNSFINRASPYREDRAQFGQADRWQTPGEFLSGAGDCEDYAIAKFFSLLELGFTNEQLRIVIVHDRRRRMDHAVVAVTLDDGDTYILDSLLKAPLRHENLLHYDPVYSVNLNARWGHVVTAQIRNQFVAFMTQRKPEPKQFAAAAPRQEAAVPMKQILPAKKAAPATTGAVSYLVSDIIGDLRMRLWPQSALYA